MEKLKKQEEMLKKRMKKVKHKVAVISGKGGVGKSIVTANIALSFAKKGYKIGILDADFHGPSIPKILGVRGSKLEASPLGILPVTGPLNIKIVSIDFLLPKDETPVVWRGPLKMNAIRQFLSEVAWGDLDILFIDLPPGTGDEPLSVIKLIPEMSGVVVVTTPSEVSQLVVKKSIEFAKELSIPVIGVIENMSGFACPNCGFQINLFNVGGGEKIAKELNVPFLGKIPLDIELSQSADEGAPLIIKKSNSKVLKSFFNITNKVEKFLKGDSNVS
ncbi:Mrp/NBP35 family ATP-binding protein [Candidatus Bathyarchaeota archaeon]|nr:Mrp/NBP35 family ATP-binding protein [Candidatus Bathyarchaeota archaeon]